MAHQGTVTDSQIRALRVGYINTGDTCRAAICDQAMYGDRVYCDLPMSSADMSRVAHMSQDDARALCAEAVRS